MSRQENRHLPVVIPVLGPDPEPSRGETRSAAFDAAYAAQLYGQPGQRRGLRGGAPVLEAARAAYLEAEYSGEHDRRPPQGLIMTKAV